MLLQPVAGYSNATVAVVTQNRKVLTPEEVLLYGLDSVNIHHWYGYIIMHNAVYIYTCKMQWLWTIILWLGMQ